MTSPSPSAPTGREALIALFRDALWSVGDIDCDTTDEALERDSTASADAVLAAGWRPSSPGTGDQRVNIARAVADHWRNAAMAHPDDDMIPFRVMAHPLCMVLSALDGETDPNQLGVSEGPDADRIAALAQRVTGAHEQEARSV